MKKKSIHKNSAPVLRVDESVSLEEQIAQRAHELWQQRDREHGHDLTDWLRAEREINEWGMHVRVDARISRFRKTVPRQMSCHPLCRG